MFTDEQHEVFDVMVMPIGNDITAQGILIDCQVANKQTNCLLNVNHALKMM